MAENTNTTAPTIYNYDPTTGALVSTGEADESPLEPGVYLVPANATLLAPPVPAEHQLVTFVGDSWTTIPDWRGHQYYTADGELHQITEVSVAPPPDALSSAPPPPFEEVKKAKSTAIKAACAASIVGGFQSNALGGTYTYASDQTDQSNLAANVLSSLYPNLPVGWTTLQLCCDDQGVWNYREHTAAQMQQVGKDGKSVILYYLTRNAGLQMAIAAATDTATLDAISWT